MGHTPQSRADDVISADGHGGSAWHMASSPAGGRTSVWTEAATNNPAPTFLKPVLSSLLAGSP